jgi:hypothetical protein
MKDWQSYFMARVAIDPVTSCWVWQRMLMPNGYGQMGYKSRGSMLAHRAAYEVFVGPLIEGLMVCHTCDNPRCVNPAHLVQATAQWNAQDMKAKQRGNYANACKGSQVKHLAKMTEASVLELRSLEGQLSNKQLAEKYGITVAVVGKILRRKTWKHI